MAADLVSWRYESMGGMQRGLGSAMGRGELARSTSILSGLFVCPPSTTGGVVALVPPCMAAAGELMDEKELSGEAKVACGCCAGVVVEGKLKAEAVAPDCCGTLPKAPAPKALAPPPKADDAVGAGLMKDDEEVDVEAAEGPKEKPLAKPVPWLLGC